MEARTFKIIRGVNYFGLNNTQWQLAHHGRATDAVHIEPGAYEFQMNAQEKPSLLLPLSTKEDGEGVMIFKV